MNRPNRSITTATTLTETELSALYELATQAGEAILAVYHDEARWHPERKSDDTPVTAADIDSSRILVAGLGAVVDCPVVSEEALPSYSERNNWSVYWLVDPLDGTREFLHKTDEFVINIALMVEHQPVFGFLYQPTTGQAWWGAPGQGAFCGRPAEAQPISGRDAGFSLVALGSRRSRWQGAWRDQLTQGGYQVSTQSVGSALKFARLAEGSADLYPRLGPTSEWDTAAPQAILEATGGGIRQWNGEPLVYGKKNTLNPHFIAVGDVALLGILTEEKPAT